MAKDELFERNAHPKAQDSRAKPSDRSRRELDDHRPLFVNPKLGVDRTIMKAQAATALAVAAVTACWARAGNREGVT